MELPRKSKPLAIPKSDEKKEPGSIQVNWKVDAIPPAKKMDFNKKTVGTQTDPEELEGMKPIKILKKVSKNNSDPCMK